MLLRIRPLRTVCIRSLARSLRPRMDALFIYSFIPIRSILNQSIYLFIIVPLQQTRVSHATVGAGGQQGEPLLLVLQAAGRVGHQPTARGAERVSDGQRPALGVHFVHINVTDLFAVERAVGKFLRAHGFEIGQNLARKGLVDFKDANVGHLQLVFGENFLRTVRRTQQQLLKGVAGLERPVAEADGYDG